MQDDTALRRFQKFKAMMLSADIPTALLLELAESYMTSDADDSAVAEAIPVMDGQLSLLDTAA